jgi:hypothetical protein
MLQRVQSGIMSRCAMISLNWPTIKRSLRNRSSIVLRSRRRASSLESPTTTSLVFRVGVTISIWPTLRAPERKRFCRFQNASKLQLNHSTRCIVDEGDGGVNKVSIQIPGHKQPLSVGEANGFHESLVLPLRGELNLLGKNSSLREVLYEAQVDTKHKL